MPRWLKALLLLAAVLWALVVYRPYLFGTDEASRGFIGDDLSVLVSAAGQGDGQVLALQDMSAADYAHAAGPKGSFLGGASMALSRRLWAVSESSATFYRLENLLLLLAMGLGLGHLVRRLLVPWTGLDHARAAARGVPVVMAVHPFTVHAVARLGSRGEFLSMALGAWAAATYLRARQERKPGSAVLAGVLVLLAHFAGGFGFGLAILLAVAEGLSVQRYQNGRRRLLRAVTTWAVFTAIASIELIVRAAVNLPVEPMARLEGALRGLFERVGILLLPLPTPGPLQVVAVLLFLLAMHPALRAARAAPRLWGWLLCVWGGVLCAILAFHRTASPVRLGDFTAAADLFPASVIFCTGLVIVATAVQGFRRLVLPIALAVGLGSLSLAQARAHTDAVRATHQVRVDLEVGAEAALQLQAALAREGRGTTAGPSVIVLLDQDHNGVAPLIRPFQEGIGFYLDASLIGRRLAVRAPLLATSEALAALAREPEFDERRRGGLVVMREHVAVSLSAPAPLEMPPLWRGDALSPELNLDPLNWNAVLTVATSETSPINLPTALTFRMRGSSERKGQVDGVWVQSRGRLEGRFDLSNDLNWLFAEHIARVGFESGLARLESGHFYAALQDANPQIAQGLSFEREGSDWRAATPADGAELKPLDAGATDAYVLTQLDLGDLTLREWVAETHVSGSLVFLNAEPAQSVGEVAWALERRVNGRVIWRTRGRVQ